MPTDQEQERRADMPAVPDDIRSRLTELQRYSLARLEGFGWSIRFVRRQSIEEPIVVLVDPSGQQHGVLLEDGSVDRTTDLNVR